MSQIPKPAQGAHALRVVRLDEKADAFVFYEGVTFPDDPWQGCELWIRRCFCLGMIKEGTIYTLDVLNSQGDVIQDFPLNRQGFRYLRSRLKFKRERDEDEPDS